MAERTQLTPGKVRGLSATSTAAGHFSILAIDHRDSLRVELDPTDPEAVPVGAMTDLKLELLAALGQEASAVMLDPEYSAAQAVVTRTLPGNVGFLAAIEAQGYLSDAAVGQTSLLDGWSVEKAKRLGANGIKLLVLYRPDAGAVTEAQERIISAVVADCARYDIPLFLEPLDIPAPQPSGHPAGRADERRALLVATVRRLGALGPDVLKVRFPVDPDHVTDRRLWQDACQELDEASPVPWALLSGGGTFESFREQVDVACRAGASGFMVGRALWGEYVRAASEDRPRLVAELLRPRFEELSRIVTAHARDWAERHSLPSADDRWHLTY